MKVTALLPNDVIHEVRKRTHGKNITESLLIALTEWLSLKKISELNEIIEKSPLQFRENFSAVKNRSRNRKK